METMFLIQEINNIKTEMRLHMRPLKTVLLVDRSPTTALTSDLNRVCVSVARLCSQAEDILKYVRCQ